ncbi:MAG: glycosyltransferase [Candidatus Levybacteria bacterium]|nr:glycosyltransferase [Candidatus Levybacteria bacterium]
MKIKKPNRKLISLIIPTFKQEKTIQKDVLRIKNVLDQLRYNYEIIIVVDGMVDKSFQNAKKVRSPKIKVIGYPNNRGKGHAIRFGMGKAKGDIIAFLDSGMDINPNGLSMLLEHFEWYNADIIVGSKLHPVSKVNYPFSRKILTWGYRSLVKALFGLSVRDTQVGMKFFKRKTIEDVLPRLLVKAHAFDIEVLAVAYRLGYKRIFEAPIELNFNGMTLKSRSLWKVIILMLWDTLAVFYRLRILKYYDDSNQRKWKYDPELNFRINLP